MSENTRLGTVARTVPNCATDEETMTSPVSGSEVGTVGTVFPDCTYVRAGMNKERARDDFPENGGQLSPTVPARPVQRPGMGSATPEEHAARCHAPRYYDVHQLVPLFGIRDWLGRIQAKTRAEAETIAAQQFGRDVFVSLAYGSTRRARKDAQERARNNPPRHRRSR
jgi:hypothetical protein